MKIPDPRTQSIVHEKVLTANELKYLKETFEVREWDATGVATNKEMLTQIGELWDFPSYYGQNWDAFVDCLSDLSWIPASRFAFVIRGHAKGEDWDTLLECLEDVSARSRDRTKESGFVTVLIG
jgi:RNAse (barnase) inhibitor barstar